MSSTKGGLGGLHQAITQVFKTGKTRSYDFRVRQLQNLKRFLKEEEKEISLALAQDLHRSEFEAAVCEIVTSTLDIDYVLSNLKSWMEPNYTPVPALFAPASSEIVYEPYGVCLILGAFNYPISLTIGPLVGAIAAGNCAVIKPSEMVSATEKLINERLPKYLDNECFRVVCGDVPVTTELLSLKWDKIFFTGSTRVGKIVLSAAATHLTPVSLELGGKSPTIIDESVTDLELAAQRVVWGKCVNAGQTCIAPDYVYIHEKHYDKFLALMKQKIEQFYGKDVQKSPDFCRVVNQLHFKRLKGMLEDAKDNIYCGGKTDESEKFIEPTIITNIGKQSKVMSEEIFGPLLPVFKYKSLDEVIDYVNEGEKPLTLYIFAKNRRNIDKLTNSISSGSVLVNDCLFQFANVYTPFGGVGHSGMGGYHGKFSFECFSHRRTILRRDDHRILDVPIRYPPYTSFGLSFFKFASTLPDIPAIRIRSVLGWGVVLGVVVAAAVSLGMQNSGSKWF